MIGYPDRRRNYEPFFHVHHGVLFELSKNIEERIDYIKNAKPDREIPLRLKLLRKVKGPFPAMVRRFIEDGVFRCSCRACVKRFTAEYVKRFTAEYPGLIAWFEKVHKKQCEPDCPWTGRTIFPRKRKAK
jgi:hypothetical protein